MKRYALFLSSLVVIYLLSAAGSGPNPPTAMPISQSTTSLSSALFEPDQLRLLCFGLFGLSVVSMLALVVRARREAREVQKFAETIRAGRSALVKSQLPPGGLVLGVIEWPSILARVRVAFEASVSSRTLPNLDSTLRGIASELAERDGWLRPIPSALIVTSLLGTFAGLKEATERLAGTLAAQTNENGLKTFLENVGGAMNSMSAAFGTNLWGILLATILGFLLPLLRRMHRNLHEDCRSAVDDCVRPALLEWLEGLSLTSPSNDQSPDGLGDALRDFKNDLAGLVDNLQLLNRELVESVVNPLDGAQMALLAKQTDEVRRLADGAHAQVQAFQQLVLAAQTSNARLEATNEAFAAVAASLARLDRNHELQLEQTVRSIASLDVLTAEARSLQQVDMSVRAALAASSPSHDVMRQLLESVTIQNQRSAADRDRLDNFAKTVVNELRELSKAVAAIPRPMDLPQGDSSRPTSPPSTNRAEGEGTA